METVAAYLVKREDIEGIRFLEQKKLWSEPSLQKGMDVAARGEQDGKSECAYGCQKRAVPEEEKDV